MRWLVVVLACVAVVALVVWFVMSRQHPEQAATHATGADRFGNRAGPVARRPAGPDAENMSSDRPGGRTPAGPDLASDTREPE